MFLEINTYYTNYIRESYTKEESERAFERFSFFLRASIDNEETVKRDRRDLE
jgi:hypothetical protein